MKNSYTIITAKSQDGFKNKKDNKLGKWGLGRYKRPNPQHRKSVANP